LKDVGIETIARETQDTQRSEHLFILFWHWT